MIFRDDDYYNKMEDAGSFWLWYRNGNDYIGNCVSRFGVCMGQSADTLVTAFLFTHAQIHWSMTTKQQSIVTALKVWFKGNATTIIAFTALSWQISTKIGGYAYYKVTGFIDTVQSTSARSYQTQRDLSEFKINQHEVDRRQNMRMDVLARNNR